MKKIITVAVIGAGARGNAYTGCMLDRPDEFKVVAICDKNEKRVANMAKRLGVDNNGLYYNEDEFFKEKRADLLIVATQDQDHVGHAIKGLELGYDILTEKPISNKEEECRQLLDAQRKAGRKVFVCHVLRYAPAFVKMKELIDCKLIGETVMIDVIEQVWYFHQAHSYVRGNWRRTEDTSPMIIAKCCHDLDILQWYANSRCESISSIGDLRFFKKENQPEGASDRCCDCKYKQTCPYSAVEGYKLEGGKWGASYVTDVRPVTQEAIDYALKTGPYGRCVFASDNDAVDNQIVTMRFENGITANLRMTGFTHGGGRIVKVYGTYGELVLEGDYIKVKVFGKKTEEILIKDLMEGNYAHGGGDGGLISALYGMLTGETEERTSLSASVESHLMGFAAEKSRLNGGMLVKIEH
ncbi:MAG: Gfo/Idh/MocA family oxidoreductase [Clostridia bacterium]|nr:Gfo/Idh/MocA family oxidoreductase [Clostridia bacterium]